MTGRAGGSSASELPLNQIAISVADVQLSQRWYRDLFGFQESGGTSLFVPLLGSDRVQGVPGATSVCWWLMDSQDFFQIELFQFSKPTARPLPEVWRPCDIGYSTIGIHVADFDATLERLERRRVRLLSDPIGAPGSRRVCVRDPDGVLLEVMEDDPRSGAPRSRPHDVPVATRFVTLSVPDLEEARHTWVEVLGLTELPGFTLHGPEHEELWGLSGATRQSFVLRAGDMFIEVVHYLDPVGRPWPDGYRISDLGLLNIALGLRTFDALVDLVGACEAAGIPPNAPPPTTLKPVWSCSYVNDSMGFSIELLYLARPGEKRLVNPFDLIELGFRPTKAPVHRTRASQVVGAPPARVWQVLVDHTAMSTWSPFRRSEVVADPDGHGGVGTMRRLSGGPLGMSLTERIVAAEEPYRLEYTAEGAPGQDFYHGFVTLEPLPGGGTRLTWEAQFHSRLPGVTAATTRVLRSLVQGLTRVAEQPIVEEGPA
ncbi:MAG TPA: SRPBCC family protein [Acidimicrobiales bacterium]